MKKIICFDSWTEGAHNFERLVDVFEKNGFKLILIHIGSFGHDLNRSKEELIGKLLVRDISFYSGLSLFQIIDSEKPKAILFLSTRAFAHMAVNAYAKYLKIPTCHLYHGIINVQALSENSKTYKINLFQQLSLLVDRAYKNFFRLIPTYLNALVKTRSSFSNYIDIFKLIIYKVGGSQSSYFVLNQSITTLGCVYIDADVNHMKLNYGIPAENIFIVGNPDLMRFQLNDEDICYGIQNSAKSTRVMYIDTALSKSGFVFNSDEDFINHLLNLKETLSYMGYDLIVKLHPSHKNSIVPELLAENKIYLSENDTFITDLKDVCFVIVEPSTAALIPALLGLPIGLAKFGKLKDQNYGSLLLTYPRAFLLNKIEDVKFIELINLDSLKKIELENWIYKYIGPLPASRMPIRVFEALNQFLDSKKSN